MFKPLQTLSREEYGMNPGKKYVLFLGNPDNPHKNFKLLQDASRQLDSNQIVILAPYPLSHDKVVSYLNLSDLLVLTSFAEGSPNVIKEALACNCPVVSTPVGDVPELIKNIKGCEITTFDPDDLAAKILSVITRNQRINSRNSIRHLDNKIISKKIIQIYQEIINE